MNLNQPVTDVIRSRSSRRKYVDQPIEPPKRKSIEEFLDSELTGPFGSKTRFQLVTATEQNRNSLKGLGTYGMIRNPPGFVVGAVSKSAKDLEDFGYVMENIILRATDLGLGTCWLGGSFTRSSFAEKISAQDSEIVPAVAAIGHATEQRGTIEKVVRWGAKAKKRHPWESMFFDESFLHPLQHSQAGEFQTALEMIRIGPSASNKQPWRVIKSEQTFHFYLQRHEKYTRQIKMLRLADIQRVDMGIAMSHFEATLKEQKITGKWIVEPPNGTGPLPELTEYVASFVVNSEAK